MTQILRIILKAFSRAFNDLFQFKVLWIVIWPLLAASTLWLMLGSIFWDTYSQRIGEGYSKMGVVSWMEGLQTGWIVTGTQVGLYLILFFLLVTVTSLTLTAIFSMPALIHLVACRYYPELKYEHGGSIVNNVINAMIAFTVFILIWIVTLPLWVIGIGVIVPFVAVAYLNQQLFRYDALSEHASYQELKVLLNSDRVLLWSLGLLTGSLQFIPILNFFAPTLSALAFIHFELARLSRFRSYSFPCN